ncbi:hypothetical protein [Veillonella caviae]|uniref:hypothetical protein n=1 Tax=Veillonella caviae TaxID=248316 RepID=UPI0023F31F84|nr:hypothetical protein [Veillonella caviae]MCI6407825.1 hypothetical protein [Veillonella caviae]MDY6224651.1 hypothetical protein [Veillonella caviae]
MPNIRRLVKGILARMLNSSNNNAVQQNGDDSDTFIEDVGGWLVALFIVALIIMFILLL